MRRRTFLSRILGVVLAVLLPRREWTLIYMEPEPLYFDASGGDFTSRRGFTQEERDSMSMDYGWIDLSVEANRCEFLEPQ